MKETDVEKELLAVVLTERNLQVLIEDATSLEKKNLINKKEDDWYGAMLEFYCGFPFEK